MFWILESTFSLGQKPKNCNKLILIQNELIPMLAAENARDGHCTGRSNMGSTFFCLSAHEMKKTTPKIQPEMFQNKGVLEQN